MNTEKQSPTLPALALANCSAESPIVAVEVYPKFRFEEYNPRRRARGVEAVRIEIQWNREYSESLWMSRRDLVMNIKEFGEDPALVRGLACYVPNT